MGVQVEVVVAGPDRVAVPLSVVGCISDPVEPRGAIAGLDAALGNRLRLEHAAGAFAGASREERLVERPPEGPWAPAADAVLVLGLGPRESVTTEVLAGAGRRAAQRPGCNCGSASTSAGTAGPSPAASDAGFPSRKPSSPGLARESPRLARDGEDGQGPARPRPVARPGTVRPPGWLHQTVAPVWLTGVEEELMSEKTASQEIDDIIAMHPDWRGRRLAELRRVILDAAPGIEEAVKWRKPSRPEGVAVWMHGGNLCMADVLKRAVRLTFPDGAALSDPSGLFNARLDSKSIRAIDVAETDVVDEAALRALIVQAVRAQR